MQGVVLVFLRRMRAPLLALVATYAIAMLGLVLMPGVDPEGRPWRMSFFHAFYVLAYTATTTGFGELPHPYSEAQRMWLTFSLYMTVIAWIYAVGKIIALLQDPAFQRVLAGTRFARRVRALKEPFVIVYGYGETGSVLVEALDRRRIRSVVIDASADRINEVDLAAHSFDVHALCADARKPETLVAAGLREPQCAGLAALTDSDGANLAAAVAAKLLRPDVPVLARCQSPATAANMASFGTDHIINPFDVFARELALLIEAPGQYLLRDWLTAVPGSSLSEPLRAPRGAWIVCGYGRFGHAIVEALERAGNTTRIIEPQPDDAEREGIVRGSGTEAVTLEEAGIHDAVGIVAGTSDDVNNFSIAMTARQLRPGLFVVMRKNHRYNDVLFDAFEPSLVMQSAQVIATESLAILTTPLLARFLAVAERKDNDWANELLSRIAGLAHRSPEVWSLSVTPAVAPAAWREAVADRLRLDHLLLDHANRAERLDAIALLLERDGRDTLLPPNGEQVEGGDRILFCGSARAKSLQLFAANNQTAMNYVTTGDIPHGAVWSWVARALERARA